MGNIYNIIENRATCRNFLDKQFPDEVLNRILNAGCSSPSGGGFQTYSIIKVKNDITKKRLSEMCRNQNFIAKSPVCLVFCIDYRRIKRINEVIPAPCDMTNNFMNFWMAIQDTAICAQTMCLAAEEEGLKSVYLGNIIHTLDQVSDLLKLPKYVCPSIMVALGYPKNKSNLSKKYKLDVIVHDEEYRDMDIDRLINEYEKKYESWNMKPTDIMINKIYDTCYRLHGKEFADKCKDSIINSNEISAFQFWYGYYYLEQEGFLDLDGYIEYMKKQGFNWIG